MWDAEFWVKRTGEDFEVKGPVPEEEGAGGISL